MRRLLGAALLMLLALAVGGYFRETPPAAPGERLRLGTNRDELAALVAIAQARGDFAREGLAVDLQDYPSGKRALEGLFAGAVDLAVTAEVPVVFASFRRDDLRIVANLGAAAAEPRLIARRSAGIHAAQDLRGKRIATQQASAVHFFLHLFLLRHGLSERDVVLVFLAPDEMAPALRRGEIDAFSMREPYVGQAAGALGADALLLAEPALYTRRNVLVAPAAFVAARPQTLRKLLRALLQAEAYARQQPEAAIGLVAAWLGTPPAALARRWPELKLDVGLDQALLVEMEDEARWALDNRLVEAADGARPVPDTLAQVHLDALLAERPQAVTVVH